MIPSRLFNIASPEIKLLVESARIDLVHPPVDNSRLPLPSQMDWTLLIRESLAHGVTPQLYQRFLRSSGDSMPEDIFGALQLYCENNLRQNRQALAELANIADHASRASIPVLAFGSLVFASGDDQSLGLCQFEPLHLLVAERYMGGICNILRNRGFHLDRAGNFPDKTSRARFIRDQDEFELLLFRSLAQAYSSTAVEYRGLWQRSRPKVIAGQKVYALAPDDMLLARCIMASGASAVRLKDLREAVWLASITPSLKLQACVARARRQGCEAKLFATLELAQRVLNVPLPNAVQKLLRRSRRSAVSARILARRGPFRRRGNRSVLAACSVSGTVVSDPARAAQVLPGKSWLSRSDAWDKWANGNDVGQKQLTDALLDAANIRPGQTVLDVAAGVGEPALSASRLTGDQGHVIAMDLVAGMLGSLRCRAREEGLDNIDCVTADMENLPFPDKAFDSIVCRFGVMFSRHPGCVMGEAFRVTRPGATAAFMVWGSIEQNTLFHVFRETADTFLGINGGEQSLPLFRFGKTNELAATMCNAGFNNVRMQEFAETVVIPGRRAFWQGNLEMSYGQVITQLPEKLRAGLDEQLEAAFMPYLYKDGYHISIHVRVASGVRPPEK